MSGVMIVKQRVEEVDRWKEVFHAPQLDQIRRDHGLVVTGTYVDANEPSTVIVVMTMEDLSASQKFEESDELAEARRAAGAVGFPEAVWRGASC